MHWLENISQLQEVKADNGGGQDGELQRRHRRRVASGSESVGELPPKSQIRAELTTTSQHSTCSAASAAGAASAASAISAVSAVALYLLITFYLGALRDNVSLICFFASFRSCSVVHLPQAPVECPPHDLQDVNDLPGVTSHSPPSGFCWSPRLQVRAVLCYADVLVP